MVQTIAPDGVAVYDARIWPASGGFHCEVVLDGLQDPRGAVSVEQCESCSRALAALLDRQVQEPEEQWAGILPPGLTAENYSLEVSSAGAERRLRLPEDLERFRGLPMRFKLPKKTQAGKDTIEVRLVVFDRTEGETWIFREYEPGAHQARRIHRRRQQRMQRRLSKKKSTLQEGTDAEQADETNDVALETAGELRLRTTELRDSGLKANLYLDY
jgi:ribosome maturation factor RimP